MNLPTVYNRIEQTRFFIFTACDQNYFDNFGKILINSILKNTNLGVHIHIFNPADETIKFCQGKDRISLSYEYVPKELFISATRKWETAPITEPENTRYRRIHTAMKKGRDLNVIDRIQKTYYACARFIRLENLTKEGDKFFAMDVDAIVRKNISFLAPDKDCYLHMITGEKARVLAGGLYTDGNLQGRKFLKEYSDKLIQHILNDDMYWSMDQDILDIVVPKYNIGHLPLTFIDWEMQSQSIIWTAKGSRKNLSVFISEQQKYMS